MVRNYKRKTVDRWTKEDLLNALMCIKNNELKINDAARTFGISRATLYRQYAKFIQGGAKCDVNQFRTCGGNPILTKVEEDVLEKTITDLRAQGFTVGSTDIKRICFEYCDSNGIPNQFNAEKRTASDDWYYGFLKRHPSVGKVKSKTNADGTPDDLVPRPKAKRRSSKAKADGSNGKRSTKDSSTGVEKSGKNGMKAGKRSKVKKIKDEPVDELDDLLKGVIKEDEDGEEILGLNDQEDDSQEEPELMGLRNGDDDDDDDDDETNDNDEEALEDEDEVSEDGERDEIEEDNEDEEEEDDEEVDEVEADEAEADEVEVDDAEADEADVADDGSDGVTVDDAEEDEEEDDDVDAESAENDQTGNEEDDDVEVDNDEAAIDEDEEVEAENDETTNDDEEEEAADEEEDEEQEDVEEVDENEAETQRVDDEDDDESTQQIENDEEDPQEIEEEEEDDEEEEEEDTEEEEIEKNETKRSKSYARKQVDEVVEQKRVTPTRSRKRPARYESLSRSSTPTLPTRGRGKKAAPVVEVDHANGETPPKRRRSRKNLA